MPRACVTFVLPGDFRSGGVRVTVIMANLLRDRGHRVRIAHPLPARSLVAMLRRYRSCWLARHGNTGWLGEFRGPIARYRTLDDLAFAPDEVVIAVGTYVVDDVRQLSAPVLKMRFNHGLPTRPTPQQQMAWTGSMPTITVSHTLVPQLEALSGEKVLGVVPNGIDLHEYFPEPSLPRDGLGAIFNPHPNKAPHDLLAVLQHAHARWPWIPQHVFSTEARPRGLAHANFVRYPPIAQARELYSRSKVWLLTSYTEGLPGAVLEAMACGCVVVTSDNDGSLEVIRDGENGLIARRGDLDAFLRAIERVFAEPAFAADLAQRALQTVQRFTWERAVESMEQVLREMKLRNNLVHS